MNLDDEMKDIGNAELGGNYINSPCVEVVTIKGYKMWGWALSKCF